ncbi:sugar ABC transporter permease [Longispora fulva]|uniref:Lactose/L-arabinose transport system permease protein n=1 Tax=Longispora fulva TaxID=619741 RepID=A0A8J7GIZ3_9ACTN|nr:carbohydrate ABC transporter permease [Longispora fulva]MBG6141468.1 lactose/L-arabinose transport system permease protein [Longispora fulva]GIG59383.1 sugar ABC transporter permease [Longispora fulva]
MKRLAHLPLAAGAVVSLFPFYWMIVAATHRTRDLLHSPPPFLPGDQLWENLRRLEDTVGFTRVTVNTVGLTVVYTALSSLISAMCGYGLAKFRFRGRGMLLAVLLATMMIPFQVLLVPLFQMMANVGWIDTYQAVLLPFLANSFGIFLMRQAFLEFPDELIEAGRLDGCSEARIFYRIVLPAARPQLAAVVIFTFISQWSAFIWPLLMLNSEEKYTIPVALSRMIGQSHVDYSGLMLGAFIATLPIMAVFLAFQKQFVSGLLGGSVKG